MIEHYLNYYRQFSNYKYEELDLRAKGHESAYHINFFFNRSNSILVITGDYGDAIFNWYSSTNTLEDIADYTKDLSYFARKCTASSRPLCTYKADVAKEQIMDWLDMCEIDDSDFKHSGELSLWESREDFASTLVNCIDENNGLAYLEDEDLFSAIKSIDEDWWESIYDFGKTISSDFKFYAEMLQLGMKLKKSSNGKQQTENKSKRDIGE